MHHGATIGQLNDESTFLPALPWLGRRRARRMLIHAFAGEIIERIQHEAAREELDKTRVGPVEATASGGRSDASNVRCTIRDA